MDSNKLTARFGHAAFFVALGVMCSITTGAGLGAQQTPKQRRDSIARADSMKRAMAAMPGMGGMKTSAKPKAAPKGPAKRPASATLPGMRMPMRDSTKTPGAGKARVQSERRIPVKKDAAAMPAMRDSTPMKAMPGMRDTTSMKDMPKDMSAMPGMRDTGQKKTMTDMPGMRDATQKAMAEMPGMHAADTTRMNAMSMVPDPLGVSMERMGSGTTWIPDAVALPSRHFMAGQWDLMLHGFAFGQYDKQGGPRGDSQLGSLNWAMFMASHELAGGRFQARTMLSFDGATVTPRGYPLLLQTGESYHGQPLHDRQHPHDFWMELGAMYERPLSQHVGISLYGAPSGEPALGPVAFMHRPSAMDNPFAPLGHHWQDATHVSFGVLTAGVFTHDWKVEGSVFNGREPDENRWNFDPLKLDSYSGRLSFNPNVHWTLSAGYGYLKSPEILSPTESIHRVMASAMYGTSFGADREWTTTFVWGANKHSSRPGLSHSVLAESEAIVDRSNTVLARAEYVQKTAGDLVLDTPQFGFAIDRSFDVSAFSLGYIRELASMRGATLGLGGMGTLNIVPTTLTSAYGSRTPVGGMVFLRLRASRVDAGGMSSMTGMKSMGHDHD